MKTYDKGKHVYLVATAVGGVMEHPDVEYQNKKYIRADSRRQACEIYNDICKCNYYYGEVLEQVDNKWEE